MIIRLAVLLLSIISILIFIQKIKMSRKIRFIILKNKTIDIIGRYLYRIIKNVMIKYKLYTFSLHIIV